MTQAREKRRARSMPPPRHPAPVDNAERADEETVPPAVADDMIAGTVAAPIVQATATPETKPALARSRPARTPSPEAEAAVGEGNSPSRAATVYLDDELIEFLEEARIAGLISRPKLDLSKSAVVRLALRRLQRDMSVDQIREHLRAQPTDPTKTGRKRR